MPRYKLTVEYAGTRYSGWQIQKNAQTVQGELHRAIARRSAQSRFETYGSGRTDAGVHALGQVAHLDTGVAPAAGDARRAASTTRLPHDINVLAAERVPPRFHARHSAVARSYLYQIARRRTAFAKPFVWWVRERAQSRRDAGRRRAARRLRATSARSPTTTPTKSRRRCSSIEIRIAADGALILIRVVGSHFLWKMVRRLVGVLVEVRPRRTVARQSRRPCWPATRPAGPSSTAPASGLFLERVFYEPPPPNWPLESVFKLR